MKRHSLSVWRPWNRCEWTFFKFIVILFRQVCFNYSQYIYFLIISNCQAEDITLATLALHKWSRYLKLKFWTKTPLVFTGSNSFNLVQSLTPFDIDQDWDQSTFVPELPRIVFDTGNPWVNFRSSLSVSVYIHTRGPRVWI